MATVKHDGCGDEAEPADKDTAVHRSAGAFATMLLGPHAEITVRGAGATLDEAAADHLARGADLVIAEGFKAADGVRKIEVAARGRERVHARPLIALVTDRDEIATAWEEGGALSPSGASREPTDASPPAARTLTVHPDDAGMDALANLVRRLVHAEP